MDQQSKPTTKAEILAILQKQVAESAKLLEEAQRIHRERFDGPFLGQLYWPNGTIADCENSICHIDMKIAAINSQIEKSFEDMLNVANEYAEKSRVRMANIHRMVAELDGVEPIDIEPHAQPPLEQHTEAQPEVVPQNGVSLETIAKYHVALDYFQKWKARFDRIYKTYCEQVDLPVYPIDWTITDFAQASRALNDVYFAMTGYQLTRHNYQDYAQSLEEHDAYVRAIEAVPDTFFMRNRITRNCQREQFFLRMQLQNIRVHQPMYLGQPHWERHVGLLAGPAQRLWVALSEREA